jgi:hypothetical protein
MGAQSRRTLSSFELGERGLNNHWGVDEVKGLMGDSLWI